MENSDKWVNEFPSAVTVADKNGKILFMNQKAGKTFEKYGGTSLVGQSLYDCHSEASQKKLAELIEKEQTNTYTIEKNGIKKLVHQSPWYLDGKHAGIVEISIELPVEMAHFIRK